MDIEFKGQHNKKQYYRAVALLGHPSKQKTMLRIFLFILVAGFFIAHAFTLAQQNALSSLDITRVFRNLMAVLLFGYIIFMPYIKVRGIANRLWNDIMVRNPIPGRLFSQGIFFGDSQNPEVEWEEFLAVRKTDDLIALMSASLNILVLPRSFFRDESEWRRANALVDQKVMQVE